MRYCSCANPYFIFNVYRCKNNFSFIRINFVIQSCKNNIMSYEYIITNIDSALILKFTVV